MKNKKAILLLAFVCFCGTMSAQEQTVRMTTSKPQGSHLTFVVNSTARGLKVDWGNGTPVEVPDTQAPAPLLTVEGTVQGNRIQIYCDGHLTFLDCEQCDLTSLELQEARDLRSLYCAHNALSVLDVRKMHQLIALDCSYNQLKKLVFSSNDGKKTGNDLPLIEHLDISHNRFSNSYNWHFPSIRQLNISGNKYTSLYISTPTLQMLNCAENQLRGHLNLQTIENLQSILSYNNRHTAMSLYQKGEQVQQLFCDNNELQSLDLEAATHLQNLSCPDNKLKHLQMPRKSKINTLNVSDNHLDFSVLPGKRVAPKYLAFMPQRPFTFKEVEGVMYQSQIPYAPLSESWGHRHYVDLTPQGSLEGRRYDAEMTWYSVEADGSANEMKRRKSASDTGDYDTSRGKTAFFNAHKKAYVQLTSKSYGYTIQSEPIAIGDDITAVEKVRTDEDALQVQVVRQGLILTGSGTVHIFTPSGKCVWNQIVKGKVQVTLPKGIYMVNKVKVVL